MMRQILGRITLVLFLLILLIYITPANNSILGEPTITANITKITIDQREPATEQRNVFHLTVQVWNKLPTERVLFSDSNPVQLQYTSNDPILTHEIISNDTEIKQIIKPGNNFLYFSIEVFYSDIQFSRYPPQGGYQFDIDLCLTREIQTELLCFTTIDTLELAYYYLGEEEIIAPIDDDNWGRYGPMFTIHQVYFLVLLFPIYHDSRRLVNLLNGNRVDLYPES